MGRAPPAGLGRDRGQTMSAAAGTPTDRLMVARIVGFAAVVPLALLAAPVLARQLTLDRGLSPAQVGVYFLFELGGISLASFPAAWALRRFAAGRVALIAALAFIAGNVASLGAPSYGALLALRLLSALAGGVLMVLSMKGAGASADRDRLFGYWVCGQLVVGALALALLPSLFARLGLGAFFAVLALAMTALLPLAPGFAMAETREDQPAARASGAGNGILFPAVAMAGVMGFYVGLGGCWAYAALIAGQAGLDAQAVANRLAMASLVGIAGAGCAAGLGGRVVRGRALLVGYGLLVFAVLFLLGQPSMARFTLAAGLFKFGWTFALPFILSAVAHRDRTGSMMAATNLVIGTGNALGPLAAGWIMQTAGAGTMLLFCAGLIAVSLGLVLLVEGGRLSPSVLGMP